MQFAFAFAGLAVTWWMLRRQAGGGTSLPLLVLDVAPILLGWLALAAILRRPLVSAVIVFAAAAGLAVTDSVKRSTLREPLVFADRAELIEVLRHPSLYLPFAGPIRIVSGAAVALAAACALFWLEPPIMHVSPIGPVLLVAICVALPISTPVLPRVAAFYQRMGASGDPVVDMRRLGFLACLIAHATIARSARQQRRAAIPAFATDARPGGPVVLVQIESFFDARRLGAVIPPDLLPNFDRMRSTALRSGTLRVPCWGANTVRSEFAALTGIDVRSLGLDRFNPYERFAQAPTRSLAWQMKQAGYRTICLHPFDRRFYARHRVMPQLGFDEFRGLEAFSGATTDGLYVSDVAVAHEIARIVRDEGPRVFVFAMTMANHGPWNGPTLPVSAPMSDRAFDDLPEGPGLRSYLDGLRASDRMLGPMMDAMPPDGILAVYGDHQPSLPAAFAAFGHADECTDYAIWRPGPRTGVRQDIAIEDVPDLILTLQAAP